MFQLSNVYISSSKLSSSGSLQCFHKVHLLRSNSSSGFLFSYSFIFRSPCEKRGYPDSPHSSCQRLFTSRRWSTYTNNLYVKKESSTFTYSWEEEANMVIVLSAEAQINILGVSLNQIRCFYLWREFRY